MHLSPPTGVWSFCLHTHPRWRQSSLGNVSLSTEIADQKGLVWLPGFRRRLATTIRSFSLSASYPFKALMSGVLSYGLQDHWDHIRQDTFDVQWVFIDVVSKCHQNEMIEGPEDMSEDLEDSSMQCKLVENREDFSETSKGLCRQHLYYEATESPNFELTLPFAPLWWAQLSSGCVNKLSTNEKPAFRFLNQSENILWHTSSRGGIAFSS